MDVHGRILMEIFDNLLPLKQWIKIFNLQANKAFGQNFLFDLNITDKIVKLSGVGEGDHILEIGPGLGGLTISLLKKPISKLSVIEKDIRFIPLLEKIQQLNNNLHLIIGDALYTPIPIDTTHIVANLPYNISVPFILKALLHTSLKSMTVLVQKEVGERFISSNNCKTYGKISIFSQIFADIKIVYHLPPSVFIPAPKVHSVLLNFIIKNKDLVPLVPFIEKILKGAFTHRRKLLTSTLGEDFPSLKSFIKDKRCENLSIEDVVFLSKILKNTY